MNSKRQAQLLSSGCVGFIAVTLAASTASAQLCGAQPSPDGPFGGGFGYVDTFHDYADLFVMPTLGEKAATSW